MAGPFPGMDPFFEQRPVWQGFHNGFIAELRRAINAVLPANYVATLEERLIVETDDGLFPATAVRPDVRIGDEGGGEPSQSTLATIDAPARIVLPALAPELASEWSISVALSRPLGGRSQTVAVVELLSYTNKFAGPGRDLFRERRELLLRSATHYIEIDLLRGGEGMPTTTDATDYAVVVSPTAERPNAACWPIRLRDRLPTIRFPLLGDDLIAVDLQAVFDATYEQERPVPKGLYRGEPDPPLDAADAEWARERLRAVGIEPAVEGD